MGMIVRFWPLFAPEIIILIALLIVYAIRKYNNQIAGKLKERLGKLSSNNLLKNTKPIKDSLLVTFLCVEGIVTLMILLFPSQFFLILKSPTLIGAIIISGLIVGYLRRSNQGISIFVYAVSFLVIILSVIQPFLVDSNKDHYPSFSSDIMIFSKENIVGNGEFHQLSEMPGAKSTCWVRFKSCRLDIMSDTDIDIQLEKNGWWSRVFGNRWEKLSPDTKIPPNKNFRLKLHKWKPLWGITFVVSSV